MAASDSLHAHDLRHVVSDDPRLMVVDGSRLVRKLIGDVLRRELPGAQVIACDGLASARAALAEAPVDLVTTALLLPDGDGLALARSVREAAAQSYVPVIVVSGDVQARLESRSLNDDVTDYFDKALGHSALAAFIRGYVQPQPVPGARVLYVEDSRVVAAATKRMLERQGLEVLHFSDAEGALEYLHGHRDQGDIGADLVLTDIYLKGALSGRDLLSQIRGAFGYGKRALPVLVMTGDANRENQGQLLREGANDLVLKPIEERLLVTKTLFQLRVARLPEQRSFNA
ncbi:response regulator [Cognatiluteimonas weifangensis]|uniref:Response regulator n=1 Tax=Cognatiluteimonas weifangensis TaxID=2303539 RepID=A0A372DHD4_9GAMM|nr:response regulator [Luteimonas weifangensis]RFP58246.1 response regulator [Luteimonas weifangensis]